MKDALPSSWSAAPRSRTRLASRSPLSSRRTEVDLGALANADPLVLLAAVTVLAAMTKFVGAWLGARALGRREALVVAGAAPA